MIFKIETGDDLKQAIYDLGYNQSSFCRILQCFGDNRTEKGALGLLQRMIANKVRISGEIIVILNMLATLKESGLMPADPKGKSGGS